MRELRLWWAMRRVCRAQDMIHAAIDAAEREGSAADLGVLTAVTEAMWLVAKKTKNDMEGRA